MVTEIPVAEGPRKSPVKESTPRRRSGRNVTPLLESEELKEVDEDSGKRRLRRVPERLSRETEILPPSVSSILYLLNV